MGVLRSSRRHVAAVVVVLLMSGCSLFQQVPMSLEEPGAAPAETAERPLRPLKPTVKWKACGKPFKCAKVRVPIDYDHPKRGSIKLALIRLPSPKKSSRIGSLIVNPGGPGGSGVDFVRYGAIDTIPAELRARFDIIGFDPRGVGKSAPLSCGQQSQHFLDRDLVPETGGEVATILASARTLASACEAASGELLRHVSTDSVARDLDRIRRAVGDRELSYLGYSYGSFIGSTYAELFPNKIRTMVLDGPVDPSLNGLERARDQAAILEKTLRTFFKECRKDRDCSGGRGGLTLKRFDELIARLHSAPIPARMLGEGQYLRSAEALMATALLLKEKGRGWAFLAAALDMARQGDGSYLLAVAQSTTGIYTAEDEQEWLAPLLAVNCLDVPVPEPGEYAAAAARLRERSEHFGGLMLLLNSACAYWPVEPQRTPGPAKADKAPPIVVVGTTGDPTTPYIWAEALTKQLSSARLVTRDGASHTSFGGQNVCTDRHIIRYMTDGLVPPEGAGCS